MSLINQMLKDLDARRADISSGATFGQQIRAVSERRRVHPAWWVALALSGALIGVVAFVLMRPQPTASTLGTQLPLKLDIDFNAPASMTHGGQTITPAVVPDNASPAVPEASVPAASGQEVMPSTEARAVQVDSKPGIHKAPAITLQAKERGSAPVLAVADVIPAAKALAPVPVANTMNAASVPVLTKQIKELPSSLRAENEYRKAVLALQQGKRIDALADLEHALQIDSKHLGARHALIGLLLDNKQQDDAMQKARDGLNADPAQAGLAMILARLQLEKGELRPAIQTLERTLPHALERADYLAFLAALLQRDERHKQAGDYYVLALQKAPQNGVWWMGLGISLQAERRIDEAQESFKRAKATNTLSPELLAFVESRLIQLQN